MECCVFIPSDREKKNETERMNPVVSVELCVLFFNFIIIPFCRFCLFLSFSLFVFFLISVSSSMLTLH